MDIQTIIVSIILLLAIAYVAKLIWQKAKSFSSKEKSCETNCGKCQD
jgi:hypothetical protein